MIAANTLTAGLVAAGAIGTEQLAANSVDANALTVNSVFAGAIQVGAVGANEIASDAVRAVHVAANQIQGFHIQANTITADKANFTSLDALGLTVQTADIENLSVTTLKLNDQAVITGKLANNSVSIPYSASGSANTANVIVVNMANDGYILAGMSRLVTASSGSSLASADVVLKIDGTTIQTTNVQASAISQGEDTFPTVNAQSVSLFGVHSVLAGNRVIQIRIDNATAGITTGEFTAFALGVYR